MEELCVQISHIANNTSNLLRLWNCQMIRPLTGFAVDIFHLSVEKPPLSLGSLKTLCYSVIFGMEMDSLILCRLSKWWLGHFEHFS